MYQKFYGLDLRPFDLTPNPRFLVLTGGHREALANLEYGLQARKGVMVLLGEAGTGKTTVIRTALARAEKDRKGASAAWAYLRNPTLDRSEFLEFLALRFGLSTAARTSKTILLDDLERACAEGLHAALIIDEAQSVPHELLEEIRLLANIESDSEKLLSIVLAGQPELANRLNEPGLRQFKQRVALRCTLARLSLQETGAYIATRLHTAGGDPGRLFSREAVLAVHERSRGIPRTINVICDNALMTGYAESHHQIGAELIDTVCRDFDLHGGPSVGILNRMSGSPAVDQLPAKAQPDMSSEPAESTVAERVRRWALKRRFS